LAGIPPHKGDILLDGIQKRKLELPGQSLTKLILGQQNTKQESTLHRPAFSEMRFWRMIRDGDLKLVVEGIFNKPTMLFDLANDPYELNNLVKDAQYKPTIKILRQKIKIWQKLPKIRS
jgi:arylsulfatase A-like enzyme